MGLRPHADKIESAALGTIADGKHITGDLGGKASTSRASLQSHGLADAITEFAAEVVRRIQA